MCPRYGLGLWSYSLASRLESSANGITNVGLVVVTLLATAISVAAVVIRMEKVDWGVERRHRC